MSRDRQILSDIMRHMKKAEYDPITPLIDRYYVLRDRPDVIPLRLPEYNVPGPGRPRPPGRLSPSTICGCERMAAFRFIGIEGRRRLDPQVEAIFDNGNWTHHRWQYNFADMAQILASRIRKVEIEAPVIMPGIFMSGHLDVVCQIYNRKEKRWEWWVIDIKTINSNGFSWVWRNKSAKEEHVRQLISYMRARKIRRGALLYENKDNQETLIFTVTYTKAEWRVVRAWCNRVVSYMERQKLPPMHPDCEHGTFLWDKCPYKALCWGGMDKDDLTKLTYDGFAGVEVQWKKALEGSSGPA